MYTYFILHITQLYYFFVLCGISMQVKYRFDLARIGLRRKQIQSMVVGRRYHSQIDLHRYQRTLRVLNGVTSEFLSGRFVLAAHWQPTRYYFNVNILAIVTKINNNAYITDM